MATTNLYKLIILTIAVQCSACFWVTTKHEGETMRRDINRLDKVVTKQEKALGSSVTKLKKTLGEASTLLTRNSADLGARFDELSQENARLTGQVMESKRANEALEKQNSVFVKRIEQLEKRLLDLADKVASAPPPPKSPDTLYNEGQDAIKAKKYVLARELFRQLLIQYPGHRRADDAQYHRGETYYTQRNYKNAVPEFQAVFENYKTSPLADDALYRAGEAAEKLKACSDARAYYGLLRQNFSKSDLSGRANKRINFLKKNAKKRKICSS